MMSYRVVQSIFLMTVVIRLQILLVASIPTSGSCPKTRGLKVIGQLQSPAPDCSSYRSCHNNFDCTAGLSCLCDETCGRVCKCQRRKSNRLVIIGVAVSRCAGSVSCSFDADCGVAEECVCSESCGMVCRRQLHPSTSVASETRPGSCPGLPMNVTYNEFDFCSINLCWTDNHCTVMDMKCCQTICGKRCTMPVMTSPANPVSTSPSLPLTTCATMAPSTGNVDEQASGATPEAGGKDYGFVTEQSTDVIAVYDLVTSQTPTSDEHGSDNPDATAKLDARREKKVLSPQENVCLTGLGHDGTFLYGVSCNSVNHQRCLAQGEDAVCGSDGVTYANVCFLRSAGREVTGHISVRHRGHCLRHGGQHRASTRRREMKQYCDEEPCHRRKRRWHPNSVGVIQRIKDTNRHYKDGSRR